MAQRAPTPSSHSLTGQHLPTQGQAPWAAPHQTELTSSPSLFCTPSTGAAKLKSLPHSFILISNKLCFVFFICLSIIHTGWYGMKPSLLEAFWQVNLTRKERSRSHLSCRSRPGQRVPHDSLAEGDRSTG